MSNMTNELERENYSAVATLSYITREMPILWDNFGGEDFVNRVEGFTRGKR